MGMEIKSFKDLDVWQKSMQLIKKIYLITQEFPKDETYGLINQMRRSAISIPSNIAEGKTRQSKNEYIQFLYISLGSAAEIQTQIMISKELQYISEEAEKGLLEEVDHISRMLRNLIKGLRGGSGYYANRSPQTVNQ